MVANACNSHENNHPIESEFFGASLDELEKSRNSSRQVDRSQQLENERESRSPRMSNQNSSAENTSPKSSPPKLPKNGIPPPPRPPTFSRFTESLGNQNMPPNAQNGRMLSPQIRRDESPPPPPPTFIPPPPSPPTAPAPHRAEEDEVPIAPQSPIPPPPPGVEVTPEVFQRFERSEEGLLRSSDALRRVEAKNPEAAELLKMVSNQEPTRFTSTDEDKQYQNMPAVRNLLSMFNQTTNPPPLANIEHLFKGNLIIPPPPTPVKAVKKKHVGQEENKKKISPPKLLTAEELRKKVKDEPKEVDENAQQPSTSRIVTPMPQPPPFSSHRTTSNPQDQDPDCMDICSTPHPSANISTPLKNGHFPDFSGNLFNDEAGGISPSVPHPSLKPALTRKVSDPRKRIHVETQGSLDDFPAGSSSPAISTASTASTSKDDGRTIDQWRDAYKTLEDKYKLAKFKWDWYKDIHPKVVEDNNKLKDEKRAQQEEILALKISLKQKDEQCGQEQAKAERAHEETKQYAEKIGNLKSELRNLADKLLEKEKALCEMDIKVAKAENEKKSMTSEIAKLKKDLEAQKTRADKVADDLHLKHENQVKTLDKTIRSEYAQKTAKIQEECEQKMRKAQADHDVKQAAMQADYEEKMRKLKEELNNKIAEALKNPPPAPRPSTAEMEVQTDLEMEQMKAKFDNLVSKDAQTDMSQENMVELENLQQRHDLLLRNKQRNETTVEMLTQQNEELTQSYFNLREAFHKTIDTLKSKKCINCATASQNQATGPAASSTKKTTAEIGVSTEDDQEMWGQNMIDLISKLHNGPQVEEPDVAHNGHAVQEPPAQNGPLSSQENPPHQPAVQLEQVAPTPPVVQPEQVQTVESSNDSSTTVMPAESSTKSRKRTIQKATTTRQSDTPTSTISSGNVTPVPKGDTPILKTPKLELLDDDDIQVINVKLAKNKEKNMQKKIKNEGTSPLPQTSTSDSFYGTPASNGTAAAQPHARVPSSSSAQSVNSSNSLMPNVQQPIQPQLFQQMQQHQPQVHMAQPTVQQRQVPQAQVQQLPQQYVQLQQPTQPSRPILPGHKLRPMQASVRITNERDLRLQQYFIRQQVMNPQRQNPQIMSNGFISQQRQQQRPLLMVRPPVQQQAQPQPAQTMDPAHLDDVMACINSYDELNNL